MILVREKVMAQLLPYKEEMERRSREGIEKYRKGDFTLHIDVPIGTPVTVRQRTHSFRFGTTAFMLGCFEEKWKERVYREKFASLFNQAVVPLYWSDLEPVEGQPRFSVDSEYIYRRPPVDVCLDFCEEYGIEPKGHCLVWNHFLPAWLSGYTEAERRAIVERRFSQISARYADKIPVLDIVNESASNYNHGRRGLFENYDEYGLMLGGKYFAHNVKVLNETNEAIWRDFATEGKYCAWNMQLRDFFAKGLPIDELGLQYHLFARAEQMTSHDTQRIFLNGRNMMDALDMFASYGLPMNISEITIPSFPGRVEENEALQAELVELYYKLWFSIPNMRAIVWWNMVDGYAAYAPLGTESGENYYCAGLLRFDMTEKPAYRVLDRLINHEWKTSLVLQNEEGGISFRGFFGEYEIEVGEKKYTVTLDTDRKEIRL